MAFHQFQIRTAKYIVFELNPSNLEHTINFIFSITDTNQLLIIMQES